MTSLLVKGGTIATVDQGFKVIHNGAIYVEDGIILDIGPSEQVLARGPQAEYTIDATNHLVLPGLVNAHTHMFQSVLRGLGDDLSLVDWLRKMLYKAGPALSQDSIRAAVELSCLEMIHSGVSFIVDNHHFKTSKQITDQVASIILELGLKGYIARGMRSRTQRGELWKVPDSIFEFDESEEVKITEELTKSWKSKGRGLVGVCPAPVAIAFAGPSLIKEASRISREYAVPLHMHIAESRDEVQSTIEDYGCREVELLEKLGALDNLTQIVHAIWLDDSEIDLLATRGSSVVHCPVSNMYLASGIAPIQKFLKNKVNLALGTDGPASNNSQDMFQVMKSASLLCKVSTLDPRAINARQVIYMATMGAAIALGIQDKIGSLEKGKRADILTLDMRKPNTFPLHDHVSSAVYCARPDNVRSLIVEGVPLLLDGKPTVVDEERILQNAKLAAEELTISLS